MPTILLDVDLSAHGWVAVAEILVNTRTIEGVTGCGTLGGKIETYIFQSFRCAQSDGVPDVVLIYPRHRRAGFDLQLARLILEELNRYRGWRLGTWAHAFAARHNSALLLRNVVTVLMCMQRRTPGQDARGQRLLRSANALSSRLLLVCRCQLNRLWLSVSVYERAASFGLPNLRFLLPQKILCSAKSKPVGSNVKSIRCCLRREIDSG